IVKPQGHMLFKRGLLPVARFRTAILDQPVLSYLTRSRPERFFPRWSRDDMSVAPSCIPCPRLVRAKATDFGVVFALVCAEACGLYLGRQIRPSNANLREDTGIALPWWSPAAPHNHYPQLGPLVDLQAGGY